MSREKLMLDPSRTTFGSLLERQESDLPDDEETTGSMFAEAEKTIPEARAHVTNPEPAQALRSRAMEQEVHSARKVARMKLSFYLSTMGLILVNCIFFALDYMGLKVAGRYWFVWPAAFSTLAIVVRYLRAFVLRGRSLQGFVDNVLARMEEREIEKGI